MLHRVSHIRRLDDVLDDDGRLAIECFFVLQFGKRVIFVFTVLMTVERSLPAGLAQRAEFLIENVRGQHRIHNELAEMHHFDFRWKDVAAQDLVSGLHQNLPGNVHRSLLGDALVVIFGGRIRFFQRQLTVRHARVSCVVNQCAEHHGELLDRIGRDAVRVLMQILGDLLEFFRLFLFGILSIIDGIRHDDSLEKLVGR